MTSIKDINYVTKSAYAGDEFKKVTKVRESNKTRNLLETPVQEAYVKDNDEVEVLTSEERDSIIVNSNDNSLSSNEIYELMKPSVEVKKDKLFRK